MQFRELLATDAPLVAAFYRDAPDYWLLVEGAVDPDRQAAEFFTDAPPGSDPAQSHRPGLFLDGRLSGVAKVSYGFPDPDDAYLGLMLLGPWAQGTGHGRAFLAQAEAPCPQPGGAATLPCGTGCQPARPRLLAARGFFAHRSCPAGP